MRMHWRPGPVRGGWRALAARPDLLLRNADCGSEPPDRMTGAALTVQAQRDHWSKKEHSVTQVRSFGAREGKC